MSRRSVGITLGAAMLLSGAGIGFAQTNKAADSSARPKVVLVELFTSEGCSSCPPADALLRQVNGTKTSGGQLIVGISEHVTYWNSLGWSDPFSSTAYTDRQNTYGSSFGLDSVYTPQMVVNGKHQFVGSDKGELDRAIRQEEEQAAPIDLRILTTSVSAGSVLVKFSASGSSSLNGSEVFAVLADDADQSTVLRGENSGRTLAHVAVARAITKVGKMQSGVEQTVSIHLPASFTGGTGHHLILFAQSSGSGHVLGADTKAL